MELETILPDLSPFSNTRWDRSQKNYSAKLGLGSRKNKSYKLGLPGFTAAAGGRGGGGRGLG